jgi:hypothetical protein
VCNLVPCGQGVDTTTPAGKAGGSLADEVLARQARWHLRAASRKTASPSAADVFPHRVRFALDLVQLMLDNVADADDAAEPAVLLIDPLELEAAATRDAAIAEMEASRNAMAGVARP